MGLSHIAMGFDVANDAHLSRQSAEAEKRDRKERDGAVTGQEHFDFVVIGGGPAGQRGAVQAAKAGARVCLVDRRSKVGGVCLHAGTVPSKTLREAVMYLRGVRQRHFYGESYEVTRDVTLEDLFARINRVVEQQFAVMEDQLSRNGVKVVHGQARFLNNRELQLTDIDEREIGRVTGENFLLATGTVPRRPKDVPFDQEVVFDSNFIFSTRNKRKTLPKSLIVMGAGVIGTEYASVFAELGCQVHLIDRRKDMFRFVDEDIQSELVRGFLSTGRLHTLLGRETLKIERVGERVRLELCGNEVLEADALLYAMGRNACVSPLNLGVTTVIVGPRGEIEVNDKFQTNEPNIYAAGDVIGFPALASTSSEQGRMAARYALGLSVQSRPELFPFAVYTIPEISTVGKTEAQLQKEGIKYATGYARFREIPKASMLGDNIGLLKLLVEVESRKIVGVHMLGELSCELIHIGSTLMSLGAPVDVLVEQVFNYPTLAEAYRTAALDVINHSALSTAS